MTKTTRTVKLKKGALTMRAQMAMDDEVEFVSRWESKGWSVTLL